MADPPQVSDAELARAIADRPDWHALDTTMAVFEPAGTSETGLVRPIIHLADADRRPYFAALLRGDRAVRSLRCYGAVEAVTWVEEQVGPVDVTM